jgi:alkanesulfonate monooxygenase SsuD/methylene tetrahydromethanopterin reductase-like flavin-dependent oxidoreductase (luciferase family)
VGARAEAAVRRVAALGCHLLGTLGPDPAPAYARALREAGRDASRFFVGQLRFVYVAKTEDQAWEDVQAHLRAMMNFYVAILSEAKDAPGDAELRPFARPQDVRRSEFAEEGAMIGTPDQVARKLERFCREHMCTHFIMATQLPGLDPKKATRSLELFAREIMPAFRGAGRELDGGPPGLEAGAPS